MAPDFQYFLHWTGQGRDAHTFPGIVLFTLPAAVLMFLIFQIVLKWPMVSVLPSEMQKKVIEPAMKFRWQGISTVLVTSVSLVVGIVTHLAWDSFTHVDGWVVEQWPAMKRPLFYVGRTALQPYKLAQHGSTVLGMIVLAVWALHWYERSEVSDRPLPPGLSTRHKALVLGAGAVITIGVATVVGVGHAEGAVDLPWLQRVTASFVVSSVDAVFACAIAYSAIWWGWVKATNPRWRSQRVMRAVSSQ